MARETPQKRTVIFATTVFGAIPNGPAIFANTLWTNLREDPDFDFFLVTPETEEKHPKLIQSGLYRNSRKTYRNLANTALNLAIKKKTTNPILHSNNAYTFSDLINKNWNTILQINDYDAATSLSNAPYIIRNFGPRRLASLLWRRKNELQSIKNANLIICNSNFLKKKLTEIYSIKPSKDKLKVVYPTTDLKKFETNTSLSEVKKRLAASERTLGFVGVNWLGKGLDTAIKALNQINSSYPNTKLLVAGECRSGSEKVLTLIKKLNLERNVNFLGNISHKQMPKFYSDIDVLIFPSKNEGFGITIVEALANGKPVVASNVGGIPEILGHAPNSHVVNVADHNKFAEAVASCFEATSTDEQRRLVVGECKKAAQQFSTSNMIASVKKAYRSIRTQPYE